MGHFVTDKQLCADVILPDFVVEPVLLRHVGLCLAMKDVGAPLGLHLVDRREQMIRVMSEPTRSHEQYALLSKRSCKAADRLAKRASARKRAKRRGSEEHTSELQSLMRTSYAVICLKTKRDIT